MVFLLPATIMAPHLRYLLIAIACVCISRSPGSCSPLPQVAASNLPASPSVPKETVPDKPASLLEETVPEADVSIQLRIPMKNKYEIGHTKEYFAAYPYPVKPPAVTRWPKALPLDYKKIESMLFSSGYAGRTNYKPYPNFGWRWEYCYRAALRHEGGSVPHTIFTANEWTRSMVKYMQTEIKRMNLLEEQRHDFYDFVSDEFEEHGTEMENDAAKNGLSPVVLHMDSHRDISTRLAPAKWWIVGTHKIPGLTYFWELPIDVAVGHKNTLELNESNAIVIEGGW